MKRRVSYFLALTLLIISGVLVGPMLSSNAKSERPKSRAIQAAGRGAPWITIRDGEELSSEYAGQSERQSLLGNGQASPTALASADFDEDGMPDIISGYATGSGGSVTLHRGNEKYLFSDRSAELLSASSDHSLDPSPVQSEAAIFALPESPDFVGAGDFDNDGHWDVISASRGSHALQLLAGDGHGRFAPAQMIPLPGAVTALAVGEINRADGIADIIVGIVGQQGAQALVYESPLGALKGEPEAFALEAPANALALGQLDEAFGFDLAIAAGSQLVIVHGRDRRLTQDATQRAEVGEAAVDRLGFDFQIAALAVGDFVWDREYKSELALLSDAGELQIMTRGKLDRRQWADAEKQAEEMRIDAPMRKADATPKKAQAQAQAREPEKWEADSRVTVLQPTSALSLQSASGNRRPSAALIKARISSLPTDDLVVLDSSQNKMHVVGAWMVDRETFAAKQRPGHEAPLEGLVTLDTENSPVAALPMRLNVDAMSDLVVLQKGARAPSVIMSAALNNFVVNSTADTTDGVCDSANCTLRDAIQAVYDTDGSHQINFNIGTGTPTIVIGAGLPAIFHTAIVGSTGGATRVVLQGGAGFGGLAGLAAINDCSVINLVLNRFTNASGLLVDGGSIVQGCFIGTNADGTAIEANPGMQSSRTGIIVGSNCTIGGTNVAERNVISGNLVGISGDQRSAGTTILGNYIGTNAAGSASLPNVNVGVRLSVVDQYTLGGTTAGARNVISGNTSGTGVVIDSTASTVVQGNYIGVGASGAFALPNKVGVARTNNDAPGGYAVSGPTIGGTAPAARNVISGNDGDGVTVRMDRVEPQGGDLIAGNFIGTDATGTAGIPNQFGINILVVTPSNFFHTINLGGEIAGAGNVISANRAGGIHFGDKAKYTTVLGNFIGTDASGTAALGNNGHGVFVESTVNQHDIAIGGTTAGAGNVICGSAGDGVREIGQSLDLKVLGNFIGTDASGTRAMGNENGLNVDTLVEARENTIAFNRQYGVRRAFQFIVLLAGNRIYSNGDLGINERGENNPRLTSVKVTGGSALVDGYLDTAIGRTIQIEIFASTTPDPSGFGEGEEFLGSFDVTADSTGKAAFSKTLPFTGKVFYTAIGIDQGKSTAFSNALGADVQQAGPMFTVNKSDDHDDGVCGTADCTLREAIKAANQHANMSGPDTIQFNIAGTGVKTIQPTSALPTINDPVVIDGLTQPGAACNALKIELRGSLLATAGGLQIDSTGGGSTVRGLVINKFPGDGIFLNGASGNHIECNFIGTNATGQTALGNATGIKIASGSNSNFIGGLISGTGRNLLSGNAMHGIEITGLSSGNQIVNNFIGTDFTGGGQLGNGDDGIFISSQAFDNLIGGASGFGNIISFNAANGVALGPDAGTGNRITANSIYANARLGIDLRNDGVTMNDAGDSDTGPNDLQNYPVLSSASTSATTTSVSGQFDARAGNYELEFYASPDCDASSHGEGKTYLGSFFFTHPGGGAVPFTATGLAPASYVNITALALQFNGARNTSEFANCVQAEQAQTGAILVVNTTSDHDDGVCTNGDCTLREAINAANAHANNGGPDLVSFDIPVGDPGRHADGSCTIQPASPLPQATDAVIIDGLTQSGASNAAWPPTLKIELDGTNVLANQPGLRLGSGSSGSTVRGLVINRFNSSGLVIASSNNSVETNFIGTDITGMIKRANQSSGISMTSSGSNTIGGATVARRNLISGNTGGIGLLADADNNRIQGNCIGTNAAGGALGNEVYGVAMQTGSSGNLIGGVTAGEGNLIAHNNGTGVIVSSATTTGNTIEGNRIFANTGLGIDLGGDGVTDNDSNDTDSGPNNLQNFPVITSVKIIGGNLVVIGTLNSGGSLVRHYRLCLYANASCDDSGHGQGQTFLYSSDILTSNFNGTFVAFAPIPTDTVITATVTDMSSGNTSEFSACKALSCSIVCPGNLTVSTDANSCNAVVNYDAPTLTGGCGTVTCTPPSGATFPKGMTTVTCTVPSAESCSFTVTVNDTQPPSIARPANITKGTDPNQCAALVNFNLPAVADNCSGVGLPVCAPPSGSSFAKGTTTVTCTVKDGANNPAATSFTVTVNDTQAPAISCPASRIVITPNPGDLCTVVNYAAPAVTDNCPGAGVVCVPPSGACLPVGITTVNCTVTDAAGNTARCSFTVTTYDLSAQDDSTGTYLLLNSQSGDYQFVVCGQSVQMSGRGVVTKSADGCTVTLLHSDASQRTVRATIKRCQGTGQASLTAVVNGRITVYSIVDSNIGNNTAACP